MSVEREELGREQLDFALSHELFEPAVFRRLNLGRELAWCGADGVDGEVRMVGVIGVADAAVVAGVVAGNGANLTDLVDLLGV